MIGGGGEKKTLRTVARHADGWNVTGSVETMTRKVDVLAAHCADVGRDMTEIEFTLFPYVCLRDDPQAARTALRERLGRARRRRRPGSAVDFLGPEERVAEMWRPYLDLGFTHLIADLAAPVRPRDDRAPAAPPGADGRRLTRWEPLMNPASRAFNAIGGRILGPDRPGGDARHDRGEDRAASTGAGRLRHPRRRDDPDRGRQPDGARLVRQSAGEPGATLTVKGTTRRVPGTLRGRRMSARPRSPRSRRRWVAALAT